MEISSDEAIARWKEQADEETRQKKARQEFVNQMIDCLFKIEAFHLCPDESDLERIAELAVRLAHTCYKQEGRGPVGGYGIASKFRDAVRKYGRETDLKEIRADLNRRKRLKKLTEENKQLKQRLAELGG
jgi:hypothetical protein